MSKVDWPALRAAAVEVMHRAYAPYSKFPVGAAGLVDDGRIVLGCNVENAAYGVVLCAECGLVSQLHATGGGRLVAMACVDADGHPLLPCGRCRQLLWENGGPSMLIDSKNGALTMDSLLPLAFGREDLAAIEVPRRAFFIDDPDPARPKRPPARGVKRGSTSEQEEQPSGKGRAPRKTRLRDLDAVEPGDDKPRGRSTPGRRASLGSSPADTAGVRIRTPRTGRAEAQADAAQAIEAETGESGSGRKTRGKGSAR